MFTQCNRLINDYLFRCRSLCHFFQCYGFMNRSLFFGWLLHCFFNRRCCRCAGFSAIGCFCACIRIRTGRSRIRTGWSRINGSLFRCCLNGFSCSLNGFSRCLGRFCYGLFMSSRINCSSMYQPTSQHSTGYACDGFGNRPQNRSFDIIPFLTVAFENTFKANCGSSSTNP